ncbi:hypothetical protein M422DRAFT_186160, partial [Sphaerobolus stellatus SS14]
FKCEPGRTDCCCRRLLFTQPDFVNQKSQLEELIISQNHICDFYPKFHCELNFIEQYWEQQNYAIAKNMEEMEANVIAALDDVPLIQILRYANRSAKFMDAYIKGLNGAQAAWAARKYHGHRVLPENILSELEVAQAMAS